MRILQLTDLHIFAAPNVRLKGIPTRESLQDVVVHVLATEQPFDHVIITGDHTHDERPESYQAVRDILAPWSDRLSQIPGNHDDRAVLRQVFSDRVARSDSDRINFQRTAGDWLLLGLDTHVPGEVAGNIEERQIAWLTERLSASDQPSVALFLHHPPVEIGSEWMDAIGLNGRELLQEVVKNDDRIRLICCGHVHHEFQSTIGNAAVFTTPSTGIQFDPAGATPNFAADAPGYRVIEFDGADFETHVGRLPTVKYVPDND
ncbi:metallophosphoesterase family protein [Fuerstiella marisgermanici]|uniref:3',5'-cyclic adenosine monophosphate phosphodiesterase CpdA n=1 Tax=Fuerstiella marisgermanici TaxID=1891926 RepID=A0A1P8W9T6_9PLAN|nr:metallophosphoesterase [Fuerstiella marisgermanici]APZ90813.1 3',5'-cyclic adenosine monophosphate phosphodiesterase CpdA [Fuerstiella marisgermanici]